MGGPGGTILQILLIAVLGTIGLAAAVFLFFKLFGLVWKILGNVFRFVGAEISDAVRLIGVVIAAPVFAVLVGLSVLVGRWSAAKHFGRSFGGEVRAGATCVYRLLVANPLRLFGLGGVLEGVEQRVPRAMAEAPGRDTPDRKRVGMFDGYTIVGSLKGGGSGGKLYVAKPDELKRAALARRGAGDLDRVVIKVFSQKDGSTLDQILRESRALEAARRLGLVLEHNSDSERFYYVMRYVPGESLGVLTQRMHAASPAAGLDRKRLDEALGYATDLLAALRVYHEGGLWHKDVKPDNIIIDNPGTAHARAHLVDLGLVTPMRSAMTLTTHGTEYFRDPELVRQALRGVKVHQIDGAKFDVYSAGAVLYSVIENSFPAHGGLSQITKSCPEALRWVVRRAMAEYDSRYPTAAMMLADLDAVRTARDPYALKPADLPSMKAGGAGVPEPDERPPAEPLPPIAAPEPVRIARAASPVPPARPEAPRETPRISLASWWSGRYTVEGAGSVPSPAELASTPIPPRRAPGDRLPAHEQVSQARERARVRRERAHQRIAQRRSTVRNPRGTGSGFAGALFAFLLLLAVVVGIGLIVHERGNPRVAVTIDHDQDWHDQHDHDAGFWGDDLPEFDASVLVVSDLSAPLEPALGAALTHAMESLTTAGADFAGDLIGAAFLDPERSITLVAQARADRGTLPIESPELRERLHHLLWSAEDVDAVLWLAPPEKPGEGVRFALVTPETYWYATSATPGAEDAILRAFVEHREQL